MAQPKKKTGQKKTSRKKTAKSKSTTSKRTTSKKTNAKKKSTRTQKAAAKKKTQKTPAKTSTKKKSTPKKKTATGTVKANTRKKRTATAGKSNKQTPKRKPQSKQAVSPQANSQAVAQTPVVRRPRSQVAINAQVYATKSRARRKKTAAAESGSTELVATETEITEQATSGALPPGDGTKPPAVESESEPEPTPEDIDPDSMTVGEHFDDLRKYILRAFYGIAAITIAVLFNSNLVHNFLSQPYKDQVGKGALAVVIAPGDDIDIAQHKLYNVLPEYYREFETQSASDLLPVGESKDLSFWESLAGGNQTWWQADLLIVDLAAFPSTKDKQEFLSNLDGTISPKKLLVLGKFAPGGSDQILLENLSSKLASGYFLERDLLAFQFRRNVEDAFRRSMGREPGGRFIQLRPGELFGVYLKMAFLLGLLVGFPWVLYQAWGFIGPAFPRGIQRWGVGIILISTVLFWAGVFLAWDKVYGQSLYYLVVMFNFDNTIAQFSISDYYSFFFGFHFGFGIAFQLPIIIVALGRIGIVSSRFLWEKRGIVIVILAICSAILTPPDVLSQFMLLVPLTLLYLISAGLVRIMEKRGK